MGVVSKWTPPKNAAEMGRLIETFLLAEFGWTCSGGGRDGGADLDVEFCESESVAVVVMSSDEWMDLKALQIAGKAIRSGKVESSTN